jgi:glucose-6-phosphate 1-dehydrogenase
LGWSPFLHPDWEASCTKSDPRASQTDAAGIVCEHASRIDPNVITISIQPGEGISIAFDAKRPGTQVRTVTVQANFSYQASFGSKGPVAYETLLLDSMRGDATLFTRRDEVQAEWQIITPIEEAWAQLPARDFPNYAAGTDGPASWPELLKIRGNSTEYAIDHRD